MSDWINLTQAIKELGIPREELKAKIHNGCIPFRMSGTQFRINVKLVRAYLAREDIRNMEQVKKEIARNPMSKAKVKVRKVCV